MVFVFCSRGGDERRHSVMVTPGRLAYSCANVTETLCKICTLILPQKGRALVCWYGKQELWADGVLAKASHVLFH
jgi:hypothetical protein